MVRRRIRELREQIAILNEEVARWEMDLEDRQREDEEVIDLVD